MNREQTEERVRQAIEKYKEAHRIKEEAHKIIEELGAKMVLDPYSQMDPYTQMIIEHNPPAVECLHVYEGIQALAEGLGVEAVNPLGYYGSTDMAKLGFVFDRVMFFQLGDLDSGRIIFK